MTAKELCSKAALELNLPPSFVWGVYKSYWRGIKTYISELPLKENLSEEELNNLKTNINVPSLGKFYVDFKGLKNKKLKHERYSNKEAKTTI